MGTELGAIVRAHVRVARQVPNAPVRGRFRSVPAGPSSRGCGRTWSVRASFDPTVSSSDSDAVRPQTIIYDGLRPHSPIVRLHVLLDEQGGAGRLRRPNDHWHYHENVCIRPGTDGLDSPLGADRRVTAAAM